MIVGETAILEGKLDKILKLLVVEKVLKQEVYEEFNLIEMIDFLADEYCRTAAEKFYLRAMFSLVSEEEKVRVLKTVKNFKSKK